MYQIIAFLGYLASISVVGGGIYIAMTKKNLMNFHKNFHGKL